MSPRLVVIERVGPPPPPQPPQEGAAIELSSTYSAVSNAVVDPIFGSGKGRASLPLQRASMFQTENPLRLLQRSSGAKDVAQQIVAAIDSSAGGGSSVGYFRSSLQARARVSAASRLSVLSSLEGGEGVGFGAASKTMFVDELDNIDDEDYDHEGSDNDDADSNEGDSGDGADGRAPIRRTHRVGQGPGIEGRGASGEDALAAARKLVLRKGTNAARR